MPVVTIHGLPPSGNWQDAQLPLRRLIEEQIPEAVAAIAELDLKASQVTVYAPPDLLPQRSRLEVVATVGGLFAKLERTLAVQQQLSDAVAQSLRSFCVLHVPKCQLVEVFVVPFDPSTHATTSLVLPGHTPPPFCQRCGSVLVRNGLRFKCLNCGHVQ